MSMNLLKKPRILRFATGAEPRCAKRSGFTMIEVLVTILLLSIGLLGLAGLQAFTLKNNTIAYYRAIASQQASDMSDRIRNNLAGVTAGNYDNLTATMPTLPTCFPATCSTADMALVDQYQWLTANAALLAGGKGTLRCVIGPDAGCVTNIANSNRVFDITVSWTEQNETGNGTQSFVTRVTP